jgi:hypothetical protein
MRAVAKPKFINKGPGSFRLSVFRGNCKTQEIDNGQWTMDNGGSGLSVSSAIASDTRDCHGKMFEVTGFQSRS